MGSYNQRLVSYTNHTIHGRSVSELANRLILKITFLGVYQIVEETRPFVSLNKIREMLSRKDEEQVKKMAILWDGHVTYMGTLGRSLSRIFLSIVCCKTSYRNLKESGIKDFYQMNAREIQHKTYGITQRRFLMHGNPVLADWVLRTKKPFGTDTWAHRPFFKMVRTGEEICG